MKYYESIYDLPAWNWFEVSKTRDKKYLVVTDNYKKLKLSNKRKVALDELWKNLNDEFIKEFGVNEKLIYRLVQMHSISNELRNMIVNEQFYRYAKIKLKIKSLEDNKESEKKSGASINLVTGFMSKQMGYAIDLRRMKTHQFYSNMMVIDEINKAVEQERKGGAN